VRYEVEIGGTLRQVTLARSSDGVTVTVDGRAFHVDASRLDPNTWSLLVGGRVFDVNVTPDAASGQLAVTVGATPLLVAVNGRRRWGRRDDGGDGRGPQHITAPMPGKVVRVLVQKEDQVRARQPVVVVEAMKMENELRAAREGTVAELHARVGQSVDAGALLVVIQ